METQLEKTPINSSIAIYEKASMLIIDEKESKILNEPFNEEDIEIRPDGLIYLPQTFWRERLNKSFGFGQWVLIPKSENIDKERNKMYLKGVLMVRGHFVSESVGEAEYHLSNRMQSWASVWESSKSDCITRCCKDLGIANELWKPEFINNWIEKYAIKVWLEPKKEGDKKTIAWRKKKSNPFWNECSNNKKELVLNVKIEEPKKILLPDLLIENISKTSDMKSLNEMWTLHQELHTNQQFINLITAKKKALAQIKQS